MITPITKNVDIDLSLTNTYVIINAEEGDIRTRFVTITLLDNGKIYDLSTLSDSKARLQGTRSDGRAILNNCTIEDNKIKFELTADLTTCVGIHKCQVALYDNEALLTSIPFKIKINPSTLDEKAVVAEPIFSVLTDTLLRVEEANRQAIQNMEDIRVILEDSTEVNNQVRDTLVVAESVITEGREVIDTMNTQLGNITQISTDVSEAERIRQANEEQRVFNESERVKSEAIRIERENNRQTAEETRTTNEDTRQANEEVRITNENERIANETTRQQNEIVRETNEATRQSNEQERENLRDGLVTATNDANNATLEAERATQYAQQMADECRNIVAGTGLIPSTEKGAANGVASLDEYGKVPASQLPGFVDEIIEGTVSENRLTFYDTNGVEVTPGSSKMYMDTVSNKTFRWSGSMYVPIGVDLALGETDTTAFAGSRGVAIENKIGNPNGIATLNADGKVPRSQMLSNITYHIEHGELQTPTSTISVNEIVGLQEVAKTGILKITDDTTGTVYAIGVSNGELYIREV